MQKSIYRIAAVAVVLVAGSAAAQDRTGYQAIATGSLASAEAKINAERAIFPDRPELMLNLAAIYARTDRVAQARALYQDVLSRASVALDMPSGTVESSHVVAERGLSRLSASVAAR
ncbi:tetratricopeptide repeat protein [Sphingomonas sp.]|jgi:hypothetical protein|uniref:tetratricopeptide repeat protein n=1 Tax=Sphingomonas sp. TaxID=28214 RepID=UPI0035C84937